MLNKTLRELTFTVIDTETTGLSPSYARLVEIAAVKVKPDLFIDEKDTFSQLINPQCHINYSCYRVHGISDEMVANKPIVTEIIPNFAEYSKDTVIVAHNAKFDMGFIRQAFRETGVTPSFLGVLDTVQMARKAYPTLKRYNLDNMINVFNLNTDVYTVGRHRALFDAIHTAKLLVLCIESLESKGITLISDL